MSISKRNYLIYGFNLDKLSKKVPQKFQDEYRENGHKPAKKNEISLLKDADLHHNFVGVVVAVEEDDLNGGFSMFPISCNPSSLQKKILKEFQDRYIFLNGLKPELVLISHYY